MVKLRMEMKVFMAESGNVFQKNTFVTLPSLEFGVYDAAAHFNIGMKASVLIYEKLNFLPGVNMVKGCKKCNLKWGHLANQRLCPKNKLRRQILWAKKMS